MNRRRGQDPLMSLTIPIIVQAALQPADDHDIVVEDDGEDVSSDDSSDDEMTGIEVIEPIQMNLNEQGLDLVPDTGSGRSSPEMQFTDDAVEVPNTSAEQFTDYVYDAPNTSAVPNVPLSAAANIAECASADDSFSDFKKSKQPKLQLQSPQKDAGSEEGECCPICFETWANSGSHRLVSLKCGHLFGQSCIEKWLAGQQAGGKCPQCNAKAHRKDMRVIFAKSLRVIDTTERDRALQELEKEKEERRRIELEAAKTKLHYQMAIAEVNQMKQELERQRQQLEILQSSSQGSSQGASNCFATGPVSKFSFVLEKTVKVWENLSRLRLMTFHFQKAGGCRVLAYNAMLSTVCVSQPSTIPIFPGFGVKKISSVDFKTSQYVPIHSKPIRDLSFNSKAADSLLLSCSIDKSIKLTSLISNKVVQTYECQAPVWCCAWNSDDGNYFYAGQQNGTVSIFDVRNLASFVHQLNLEGSRSPVVSLQYQPQINGSQPRCGGLLVGQLEQSAFFKKRNTDDYRVHLLPLEANLTSLSLEETTGHILASYRPSPKHPNIRHQVCELQMRNEISEAGTVDVTCTCNAIQTFHSGATQKLLARSRLVLLPDSNSSQLLVCSGDEASQSVQIWNASNGQLQQKMPSANPVIDICPATIDSQFCLLTLTEKDFSVYKCR